MNPTAKQSLSKFRYAPDAASRHSGAIKRDIIQTSLVVAGDIP
jgi:hypothetical protein